MNRRQLLQGLGVLPIATAVGCTGESQKPSPRCHTLQITLEGAFAVVLRRQQSSYRVTAFSPASPRVPPPGIDCPKTLFPIEPHTFSFNGKPQPPGSYRFELLPQGLELTPRPIIDIGFHDFTAETERWRLATNFVAIDLPSPKTISFYGQPDVVVFAFPPGGGRTGKMPSNHILEYQVEDPKVGLPPQSDHDGKHAVRFFNFLLCGFFPELVKNYSISRADYSRENPAGTRGAVINESHGRVIPAVLKYSETTPRLLMVSAAVDCRSGGIIVTTDQPPMGG